MAVKPTKPSDYKEVTYSAARWAAFARAAGRSGQGYVGFGSVSFAFDYAWKLSQRRREEGKRR